MNYRTLFKEEGILIKEFEIKDVFKDVKEMVNRRFNQPLEYYLNLSRDEFHDIALEAQNELNNMEIQKNF